LLEDWPPTCHAAIPGLGDVLFCHITSRNDSEIFARLTPDDRLLPIFEGLGASVVVCCGHSGITMQDLIDHFRMKELDGSVQQGRAWSTRNRYGAYLTRWIEPRWGKHELASIKTPMVDEWLEQLRPMRTRSPKANSHLNNIRTEKPLAPGTKAKIRNIMGVLFNHAMRWEFTDAGHPCRASVSGPNSRAVKHGHRASPRRTCWPEVAGHRFSEPSN
jgi:hypothetical protein